MTKIESPIAGLVSDAERHPLAREADAFDFPLHQLNFGVSGRPTHRVLFSFDDARVVVYAVRHPSQADVTLDKL